MEMFRPRNLERHKVGGSGDEMTLSFERPRTDSGKVRERCPAEGCQPAIFLLGEKAEEHTPAPDTIPLMRREPGSSMTTCPYCGHDDEDDKFIPEEDVEHAKNMALHLVHKDIDDMLGGFAKSFNRGQSRGGLISMSMDYKPSRNPKPLGIREDLLRNIACHVCSRAYGVFALALYCPDCGAPNVSTHFNREIEIIDRQIALSRKSSEEGDEELGYRLLANAHEDVVTALETTLKSVFVHLVAIRKPNPAPELTKLGNAFQNLEKAQKQYARLSIDLLTNLPDETRSIIERQIQKRHVIGHNLGLADERYLDVDDTAEVGQSVPLLAHEIEAFAQACVQLIQSVEKELGYPLAANTEGVG